ncbi:MAG: large subunit ribosomal protein L15 [Candidatus Omnitrophota bacterium]|jgi:large subunit ribosomal protein L15
MSYLHEIKPHPSKKTKIKRVGRGPGSGVGKTAGRGHKGQKARGPGAWEGFEGGQMPLIRTMPKIGMSADAKIKFQIVKLSDLENLTGEYFDINTLLKSRLIRSKRVPIKILGNGDITRAITVSADAITKSALEKITKAGGKFETKEISK